MAIPPSEDIKIDFKSFLQLDVLSAGRIIFWDWKGAKLTEKMESGVFKGLEDELFGT